MNQYRRNLVLDIFDYSGRRLCNLYDNSFDTSGQAYNVVVTTERNGWKELSFMLPSVCETENGSEENYRLAYLKADYRIRQIDDNGLDWFIISEPKVTHQAFSKNVTVNAGHVAQLLKTKNLGLEFSDEEGNNVGTAAELLSTILKGSGWRPGNITTFYEKDGKTKKRRSLQAPAKTGAFKLITKMCDLFDAKPIFNGDQKTVDILPMNPFSKVEEGCVPEAVHPNGVLELHYGQCVSGITRTLNTDNLVTKLYAYGAYGDKTNGYCNIDESLHSEYTFIPLRPLTAGQTYTIHLSGYAPQEFIPTANVPAGAHLIWSVFDPASMSYVWDSNSRLAYPTNRSTPIFLVNESGHTLVDNDGYYQTTSVSFPAEIRIEKKQNWFSFLMDYSYYRRIGLLTDSMLQQIAIYQRDGSALHQIAFEKMSDCLNAQQKLSEIVGNINFCKLDVASSENDHGYVRQNQTDDKVLYRTDYASKERDRFAWTPATKLDDKGDPVNKTASVMYVIHDTTPVSWEKVYIQAFNDSLTDSQDGDEQKDISSILTWAASTEFSIRPGDSFYLLEQNNANALLGSWEAFDEAKIQALESITKVVTANHPVYFCKDQLPVIDHNAINGYAWAWKFDPTGSTASMMYFYFGDGSEECYATTWAPVYFDSSVPVIATSPAYWFNWSESNGYESSTLYAMTDSGWVKATNEIVNANWVFTGDDDLKDISYDISDTWQLFGTVYNTCLERDRLYQGYQKHIDYTVDANGLLAGNYCFADQYKNFHVFSTKENLLEGSKLSYDAFTGLIEQTNPDGVKTTLETRRFPFDGVRYNNDKQDIIIIDQEHYSLLQPTEFSGELRGIIEFIRQFKLLSDEVYGIKLQAYQKAQADMEALEDDLIDALGDLYREGWWQSEDYVDGDEDKLYDDALENLSKISQPEAAYNINFLDRYGANEDLEYGASDKTSNVSYSDIDIASAVHQVDPEIDINIWAYIDRQAKCYDCPWNTTITINTSQTTMAQHSFTDVLTNIANVVSEIKGKTAIYKRADALTADGTLAADKLQGSIDTAKLKIFGGNSTWYTDESGNFVFTSVDGLSAMTITGNGFAIANSKNEWGEWNWRTFGTGDGFTADEITAGYISADRIQANSISSYKLDSQTQNLQNWVEGSEVRLSEDNIRLTVTDTIVDELGHENSELRQSVISQTANSIQMQFNSALSDIKTSKEITDAMDNWFDFSGGGLKIGAKLTDGTASPFYTVQNHTEYAFWKDKTELATLTGEGQNIPQINATAQIRLGNLLGIVSEDDSINWAYCPS